MTATCSFKRISPPGPAARLLRLAVRGTISLYVSPYILDEFANVAARPHLVRKYGIDAAVVAELIDDLKSAATRIDFVPHVFDFPRDPGDAHYVDLAVAADAKLFVSRDKDLLSLRDPATPEGRVFLDRFPELSILTPSEALRQLEAS